MREEHLLHYRHSSPSYSQRWLGSADTPYNNKQYQEKDTFSIGQGRSILVQNQISNFSCEEGARERQI